MRSELVESQRDERPAVFIAQKALTRYGQTKPIQVGVWPNMKVKDGYVIVGGYHTWKVLGELGNAEIEANVHEFKTRTKPSSTD